MREIKNMNKLFYTFLAIRYCDFINIVKIFTIIILFFINKYQKVTYGYIQNTFFIILFTFVGRTQLIDYLLLSKAFI